MRYFIFIAALLFSVDSHASSYKNGDIIFQTSTSRQSQLLETTTNSKYTHVGIIVKDSNKFYVAEASSKVKITPLDKFIAKGKDHKYMVLRSDEVNETKFSKMKSFVKKFLGKNYDLKFQWDDDEMYCSELVWKAYDHAGIKLSETKTFEDFNVSSPIARKEILKRFKNSIFSLDETVVAPVDIANNKDLKVVFTNY